MYFIIIEVLRVNISVIINYHYAYNNILYTVAEICQQCTEHARARECKQSQQL